jgi:3'(2'), 5'-bisphosphate nucleotidase
VVGSRSHGSEATARFVESLRAEHPELTLRGIGSSLKLCLVAEGTADVYPRFAPTMEWDTAAADAVCRAAGRGVFRWDAERGQPLRELEYGKPELLNPWFLAR